MVMETAIYTYAWYVFDQGPPDMSDSGVFDQWKEKRLHEISITLHGINAVFSIMHVGVNRNQAC